MSISLRAALTLLLLIFLIFISQVVIAAPVIITLPNGEDSYSVELVSYTDGQVWVYQVIKLSGHDLSHAVFDFGICNEGVVYTGESASLGNDPTTGANGWKIEPIVSQNALYTFTTDIVYSLSSITVTLKAGALGNFASASVPGPSCGLDADPTPTDTETPTSTATPTSTPTDISAETETATPTPTATSTATSTSTPTVVIEEFPTATPTIIATQSPTGEGVQQEPVPFRIFMPRVNW
jgi:hypothetical protein